MATDPKSRMDRPNIYVSNSVKLVLRGKPKEIISVEELERTIGTDESLKRFRDIKIADCSNFLGKSGERAKEKNPLRNFHEGAGGGNRLEARKR